LETLGIAEKAFEIGVQTIRCGVGLSEHDGTPSVREGAGVLVLFAAAATW
jgi:hypothetical protein